MSAEKKRFKPIANSKGMNLHNALIAKVHQAAKKAGLEADSPEYRTWLAGLSGGKDSCRNLDNAELSAVLDRLMGKEPIPTDEPPEPTARLEGRMIPTARQWHFLGGLARRMGWPGGLADPKLLAHVQRTAKGVKTLGDCDRGEVSHCIAGLERRLKQDIARAEARVAGLDLGVRT